MEIKIDEQFLELQNEIKQLSQDFISYQIKYNDLIKKRTSLIALYNTKIGIFELKRYELYFECKKCKRKIEILQSFDNKGQFITKSQLEDIVEKEVREYEEKLNQIKDDINMSQAYLESPNISNRELQDIKKIYHKIIKKIHPDICSYQNQSTDELWLLTQDAYLSNDLEKLQSILLMVNDIENNDFKDNDYSTLSHKKERLENQINKLITQIEQIQSSFPFTKEDILYDRNKLNLEIKIIQDEIDEYKNLLVQLNTILSTYTFINMEN